MQVIFKDTNFILYNKNIGEISTDIIKYKKIKFNLKIPNFGILNRLDKYSSGIIIIARNIYYYFFFKKLILNNLIFKKYLIISKINKVGFINLSLKKQKKNIIIKNNKKSLTYYKIINKYKKNFFLNVYIKTGRTHQIRIHFNHTKNLLKNDFYLIKKYFFSNTLHFKSIKFYYPYLNCNLIVFCSLLKEFKKCVLLNLLT